MKTEKVTPSPLVIAFVQGAQWWAHHLAGRTMWASDRDQAEAEAEIRAANGTLGKTPRLDTWGTPECGE